MEVKEPESGRAMGFQFLDNGRLDAHMQRKPERCTLYILDDERVVMFTQSWPEASTPGEAKAGLGLIAFGCRISKPNVHLPSYRDYTAGPRGTSFVPSPSGRICSIESPGNFN